MAEQVVVSKEGYGEPTLEQASARTCKPMERGAHTGAGLLAGLVTPCCSSLCLKDFSPWERLMLEQFVKNCSPWEGPTLEQFMENCLPWVGPHAGAGKEFEEPFP